jgi:hypothetical protein
MVSPSPIEVAASARRARAGSDLAPVFFMIVARRFSTVGLKPGRRIEDIEQICKEDGE